MHACTNVPRDCTAVGWLPTHYFACRVFEPKEAGYRYALRTACAATVSDPALRHEVREARRLAAASLPGSDTLYIARFWAAGTFQHRSAETRFVGGRAQLVLLKFYRISLNPASVLSVKVGCGLQGWNRAVRAPAHRQGEAPLGCGWRLASVSVSVQQEIQPALLLVSCAQTADAVCQVRQAEQRCSHCSLQCSNHPGSERTRGRPTGSEALRPEPQCCMLSLHAHHSCE